MEETIPAQPQEEMVSQSVSDLPPVIEEKKPKGKGLVAGLVILAMFALGVAGYFAYQNYQLKGKLVETDTVKTDEISETPPADPTADWETYTTNDQMDILDGFFQIFPNFKNDIPARLSFRHPKTWEIFRPESVPYKKTILILSLHKNDPRYLDCKSSGPCENFADIQVKIGMTDFATQNFDYDFWGRGYPITRTKESTINGIEVIQAFSTDASPFPMGSLYKIAPNAQVNATAELFNYNDQDNETDYSKQTIQEINQILSTFKFLNEDLANEVADWKTYTNDELSFKYPSDWVVEGYTIVGLDPVNVVIYMPPRGSALMNECMKLDTTEKQNGFVVKKFSRVSAGEMCSTNDSSPREIWIVPTEDDYSPGINYSYTNKENPQAERVFDQILSTFKFLE